MQTQRQIIFHCTDSGTVLPPLAHCTADRRASTSTMAERENDQHDATTEEHGHSWRRTAFHFLTSKRFPDDAAPPAAPPAPTSASSASMSAISSRCPAKGSSLIHHIKITLNMMGGSEFLLALIQIEFGVFARHQPEEEGDGERETRQRQRHGDHGGRRTPTQVRVQVCRVCITCGIDS